MSHRVRSALSAGLGLGYLALWFSFSSYPFQDLPNHLTRALVMGDLLTASDSPFHEMFFLELRWGTYILGDALLTALVQGFGMKVAAALWVSLSFFLAPIAFFFYLHSRGVEPEARLGAALFALFLSSNWFFLVGFSHFSLGVGIVFVVLALWERLHRRSDVSGLLFAAYGATVVATYLMHTAAFFFAGILVGVCSLTRLTRGSSPTQYGRIVLWASPFLLVILLHLLFEGGDDQLFAKIRFRDPLNKAASIASVFYRFSLPADAVLAALFLVPTGLCILGNLRAAREPLLLTIVVFLIFLALPVSTAEGYYVDTRALPFVMFLLVAAGSHSCRGNAIAANRIFLVAFFLAGMNLIYLGTYLHAQDRGLREITEAIETIPRDSVALPVATISDVGRTNGWLHIGALTTALRGTYSPYLFSRGLPPVPQKYFVYREKLYAPGLHWYLRGEDAGVRWDEVNRLYDFLLVAKPFEPSRIKVDNFELHFENGSAAVLRKRSD